MTAEETYLALLRAALWEGSVDNPESIDSKTLTEILQQADRQKTRGLVYDLLLRSGCRVPAEDAARMQQLLYRILNTHRKLNDAIARVVSALQEAGIPCVLLKGQGVARYYPNPLLRECGDIDLYVGPERLDEAIRVVLPFADDPSRNKKTNKHFSFHIGEAEIELHWETIEFGQKEYERFFRTLEAEGLRQDTLSMDFNGIAVPTPGDTFNALYLFCHAWHHFAGLGIGLRQLCDWALFLHREQDSIDREVLLDHLEKLHLLKVWQVFGCIAVRDLGLPREEFPFYDDRRFAASRRVLRQIFRDGNFGTAKVAGNLARQNGPTLHVRKLFRHLPRFFLSAGIDFNASLERLGTRISKRLKKLRKR